MNLGKRGILQILLWPRVSQFKKENHSCLIMQHSPRFYRKLFFSFPLSHQPLKYVMLCALQIWSIFQTQTHSHKKHVWLIPGWPRIRFLYPHILCPLFWIIWEFLAFLFLKLNIKKCGKGENSNIFSINFFKVFERQLWFEGLFRWFLFYGSKEIVLANTSVYLSVYCLWMCHIYHQNNFPLTQLS